MDNEIIHLTVSIGSWDVPSVIRGGFYREQNPIIPIIHMERVGINIDVVEEMMNIIWRMDFSVNN